MYVAVSCPGNSPLIHLLSTLWNICHDSGSLLLGSEHDILLVGMDSNILAYDVEQNAEIFFKDVPDGVAAITVAKIPKISTPLVIIGGHCSIQVGYFVSVCP